MFVDSDVGKRLLFCLRGQDYAQTALSVLGAISQYAGVLPCQLTDV